MFLFSERLQRKRRCVPFPDTDNDPTLPAPRAHWASFPPTGPKSPERHSWNIHSVCVEAVVPEVHIWSKKLECFPDLCQDQWPGRMTTQDQLHDRLGRTSAFYLLFQQLYKDHCHSHASQALDGRSTQEDTSQADPQTQWQVDSNCWSIKTTGTYGEVQWSYLRSVRSYMDPLLKCPVTVDIWCFCVFVARGSSQSSEVSLKIIWLYLFNLCVKGPLWWFAFWSMFIGLWKCFTFNHRGPMTLTFIAERLATELSLSVFTT